MLMSARRVRGVTQTARLRALGVVFLLVLAALLGLSVASYQKVFTPVDMVTLETDSIGNQLNKGGDVKLHGVVVGEVRGVSSDGQVARVKLAMNPKLIGKVPGNVTARLLPKTLFGERFVELVPPARPASTSLREGQVLRQDRSGQAIEIEKVFNDLLPLLQAVRPEQLNATLGAVSTALEGRGDALGENLVRVKDYVAELTKHLPTLTNDISGLAEVTSLYADAAPDLLSMLDNSTVLSRTVVEQQDQLGKLFRGVTTMAGTARDVVAENEQRLINLPAVSRPTLGVLAKYSPEFPCLLQGMAGWTDRISQAFKGGSGRPGLHITLEIVKPRRAYRPGVDEPVYGERSGPNCWQLPHPPIPAGSPKLNDGTADDGRIFPRPVPTGLTLSSSYLAGNQVERGVVGQLVAPVMGVPADEVPDIATLLFGPMARGTAVRLS